MWRAMLVGCLVLVANSVDADVYKCSDGQGGMIYRNQPCDGSALVFETNAPSPTPSPEALAASLADLTSIQAQWDDAIALASSTGRVALAGPVKSLQTLKRQGEALLVVACLDGPKQLMLRGMEKHIQAFLLFMSLGGTAISEVLIDQGNLLIRDYKRHVQGCRS